MSRPLSVVYVSYDGLQDPLGQSQILPYLRRLAARGHRFDLISFEKPGVPLRWREPIADGVRWTALRYHQRPTVPATAWDMARGAVAAAWLSILRSADLIHARSYVGAAIALPYAALAGVPLLFDTRGFWVDEKVEAGAWRRDDVTWAAATRVERLLLRHAAAVLVMTREAQRFLRSDYRWRSEIRAPIHVIPTAVDLRRFSPDGAPDPALAPRLGGARVLAYVGSFGTWYLGEAMARFYLAWRRCVRDVGREGTPTRMLVVTRSDPDEVRRVLEAAGCADELVLHAADNEHVPAALRWAEAGVALVRPSHSKRASAPTKLSEMLACGVPFATTVYGDIQAQAVLEGHAPAVLVRETTDVALERAARELVRAAVDPGVRAAARAVAVRWFDLDLAIDAYDRVYRETAARDGRVIPDSRWPRN